MGVVVRRYIDFLILLIPTPLVSVLFCSSIPTFCSLKKKLYIYIYIVKIWAIEQTRGSLRSQLCYIIKNIWINFNCYSSLFSLGFVLVITQSVTYVRTAQLAL